MTAARLGKMPTTSVRRRISLLSRSWGLLRPDLPPVLLGEGGEGQDVGRGADQHVGRVGEALGELLDHPGVLGQDLFVVGLLEDRADERGHHGLGGLGHPGQHVAHEVHPAALPGGAGEHRGNGVDEAGVGVRDHQRDPGEPSGDEAAQERRPARAVLGGDEVETRGSLGARRR